MTTTSNINATDDIPAEAIEKLITATTEQERGKIAYSAKQTPRCRLIIVEGAKGGVGKSTVASSSIDTIVMTQGGTVYIVDADPANPDVGKSYDNILPWTSPNLDTRGGIMDLVDTMAATATSHIVVSCPARVAGWSEWGGMVTEAAQQLDIDVVVLWVLGRQRDSIEALKHFAEIMPTTLIHPIINEYWGRANQFQRWYDSKTRERILSRSGATEIVFPDVADRVVDIMRDQRLCWSSLDSLPFSCRIEAERFRRAASAALTPVLF